MPADRCSAGERSPRRLSKYRRSTSTTGSPPPPPPRDRRQACWRHCGSHSPFHAVTGIAALAHRGHAALRDHAATDANVVKLAIVVRQPGAIGSRMPKMQHAGREHAVLAPHARMQEPHQQVGIFPAPALIGAVEAVDRDRDRCRQMPRLQERAPRQARQRSLRKGPSGRRISGTVRLMPPRPRSRAHSR